MLLIFFFLICSVSTNKCHNRKFAEVWYPEDIRYLGSCILLDLGKDLTRYISLDQKGNRLVQHLWRRCKLDAVCLVFCSCIFSTSSTLHSKYCVGTFQASSKRKKINKNECLQGELYHSCTFKVKQSESYVCWLKQVSCFSLFFFFK